MFNCSKSDSEKSLQPQEAAQSSTGMVKSKTIDLEEQDSIPIKADEVNAPSADKSLESAKNESKPTQNNDDSFTTNFIAPFENSSERYIEYSIELNYNTNNVFLSREELLKIISKYGFLINSKSSIYSGYSSVSAVFSIKANELYNALIDLNKIGKLTSETISTEDFTENMTWNKIKIQREKSRIERKNKIINQVDPQNKYLENREESLENSENAMDESVFEEWKAKDKVKWAKIVINLNGPEIPKKVTLPDYKSSLIEMTNSFLDFTVVLLKLSPYIILLIVFIKIFRARKRIVEFIRQFINRKNNDA